MAIPVRPLTGKGGAVGENFEYCVGVLASLRPAAKLAHCNAVTHRENVLAGGSASKVMLGDLEKWKSPGNECVSRRYRTLSFTHSLTHRHTT